MTRRIGMLVVALVVLLPGKGQAQDTGGADPDLQVVLAEPDFTLGTMPTSLRMPRGKIAFRVTHRFTYQLNQEDGGLGHFLENGLGFDSSAVTGLELRFGVVPGGQLVLHRTGSRNIQFMWQQQILSQRDTRPLSIDVIGAIEGSNNFRDEYSYTVGAILGRRLTDRGAIYVEPLIQRNVTPHLVNSDNNTIVLGLGARIRFAGRSYIVAEYAPRIGDYDELTSVVSVGVERRVGGHVFQINVSNAFDTTLLVLGRGGPRLAGAHPKHWHLGFNMSRKFF